MRGQLGHRRFVAVLFVMSLSAPWPAAAGADDAYEAVIARALTLLPRRPDQIKVVDADATPGLLREKIPRVEAFVIHGERVVYLVRQGVTLQKALRGPGIFDYALATVIWHEMAHIDGADERKAQRAEEQLWLEFVVARRVDSTVGMNYLALLRKRRKIETGDARGKETRLPR